MWLSAVKRQRPYGSSCILMRRMLSHSDTCHPSSTTSLLFQGSRTEQEQLLLQSTTLYVGNMSFYTTGISIQWWIQIWGASITTFRPDPPLLSAHVRTLFESLHFFTTRKRSCGKVMFLHLSVILFSRGVYTPSPGRHPPGQTHPPPFEMVTLQWTVQIPLKCIFVYVE